MKQNEQTLKLLGFSSMQARVYLTLIQAGRANANTLSKISNVARPDIYRVMEHFLKLGIAQKTITTPLMFEATPIEEALKIFVNKKIHETRTILKETNSLIQELKQKQPKSSSSFEFEEDLFLIPATKRPFKRE